MDLKLKGKRALVTGASSGIGSATAKTLAAEGVSVVVHGRDKGRADAVVKQIIDDGGQAKAALGDVASQDGAQSVAEQADAAFGGIDILVNNAGGPADHSLGYGMFELPPEEWLKTYERNVVSSLRLAAFFGPKMAERGWGRIINVTSGLSYSPRGIQGDYTSSKAALNNFTFNLSRSLKNTGVTVNGVSPGMTVTPMLEEYLVNMARNAGLEPTAKNGEEYVLSNVVQLTVKRLGLPQDLADAIAFLSSPRADYINGTTLRVDGGGSTSVN